MIKNENEYQASPSGSLSIILFCLMVLFMCISVFILDDGTHFQILLAFLGLVYIVTIFTIPFVLRKRLLKSALYATEVVGSLSVYAYGNNQNSLGARKALYSFKKCTASFGDQQLLLLSNDFSDPFFGRGGYFPYMDLPINRIIYKDIRNAEVSYKSGFIEIAFLIDAYWKRAFLKRDESTYKIALTFKDEEQIRLLIKEKFNLV